MTQKRLFQQANRHEAILRENAGNAFKSENLLFGCLGMTYNVLIDLELCTCANFPFLARFLDYFAD
jgi:hypothetical protein